MKCPKCHSEEKVKDGLVKEKQRYKCKQCAYRYTIELSNDIHPFYKRLALVLYIQGLRYRRIGRIMGVSNVTILNWIKNFEIKKDDLNPKGSMIKEIDIKEMHIYIDSNKTKNGCGSMLINFNEDGYDLYLAIEKPMSIEKS